MVYYCKKCDNLGLIELLVAVVSIAVLLPVLAWGDPIASRTSGGPKTLIWNYTDLEELRVNAKVWYDVKGIDGFIFCYVNGGGPPRWYSGPDKVAEIYRDLPRTVAALRAAGVDANFVHAGVDYPDWNWFDDALMAKIVPTFRALARIAKTSGCRGVAIDTEPYGDCRDKLWDPRGYPAHKHIELVQRIRSIGADVARVILEEFPEAEILVLPEGAYISACNTPGVQWYDLWMEFFNGLASRRPPNGIVVLCECGYHWTDPISITTLYGMVQGLMLGESDDLVYFRTKCSVALGAAVDFVTTSPQEFAQQWRTMRQLSPRYAWIFGAESNFWQIPDGREADRPSMTKPLPPNADKYFNVLREVRESSGGSGK